MTTAELYEKVCSILKEQGKMPDILDYGLAICEPVPITNYEFDLGSNLNFMALVAKLNQYRHE